jgi:hypothetical protein
VMQFSSVGSGSAKEFFSGCAMTFRPRICMHISFNNL